MLSGDRESELFVEQFLESRIDLEVLRAQDLPELVRVDPVRVLAGGQQAPEALVALDQLGDLLVLLAEPCELPEEARDELFLGRENDRARVVAANQVLALPPELARRPAVRHVELGQPPADHREAFAESALDFL